MATTAGADGGIIPPDGERRIPASPDGPGGSLAVELDALGESLRRITVQIRTQARDGSSGSGVLWRADGLIVTNAHVARRPRMIVEMVDGRIHHASVIAHDEREDLAALRIDAADLPSARAGDARLLRVGELLVALGHPLGVANALALGIVHTVAWTDHELPRWVVADLRLAPGNSGGPLSDATGRVVGINTMIVRGLGVAVPAERVSRFVRAAVRARW